MENNWLFLSCAKNSKNGYIRSVRESKGKLNSGDNTIVPKLCFCSRVERKTYKQTWVTKNYVAPRGHDEALSELNVAKMSQKANSVWGRCLIVGIEIEEWVGVCATGSSACFHCRVLTYYSNLTLFSSAGLASVAWLNVCVGYVVF